MTLNTRTGFYMPIDLEVMAELEQFGGDKVKLAQHYAAEMQKLQDQYGKISDIPAYKEHPYWGWRDRLQFINSLK